jgi:hypothetical protein
MICRSTVDRVRYEYSTKTSTDTHFSSKSPLFERHFMLEFVDFTDETVEFPANRSIIHSIWYKAENLQNHFFGKIKNVHHDVGSKPNQQKLKISRKRSLTSIENHSLRLKDEKTNEVSAVRCSLCRMLIVNASLHLNRTNMH